MLPPGTPGLSKLQKSNGPAQVFQIISVDLIKLLYKAVSPEQLKKSSDSFKALVILRGGKKKRGGKKAFLAQTLKKILDDLLL